MDRYQKRVLKLREHVLKHTKQESASDGKLIEEMNVDELKEVARERGLEGYSKMKKEELISALTPEG